MLRWSSSTRIDVSYDTLTFKWRISIKTTPTIKLSPTTLPTFVATKAIKEKDLPQPVEAVVATDHTATKTNDRNPLGSKKGKVRTTHAPPKERASLNPAIQAIVSPKRTPAHIVEATTTKLARATNVSKTRKKTHPKHTNKRIKISSLMRL